MKDARTILEHVSDYLLKEHIKASIRVSLQFRTELPKLCTRLDRQAFREMEHEKSESRPFERYDAVGKALPLVWAAQDRERAERIAQE